MKKAFVFMSIVVVLTIINTTSAQIVNGISFLSQQYSAGGYFSATVLTGSDKDGYPIWGNAQDSYSLPPQSNPIDYDYTYSSSNVDSSGYNCGSTSANISHNSGHLFVSTYAGISSPRNNGDYVNGYTVGAWDFQPQYSAIKLQFDISIDQGWNQSIGSIVLSDLTTGSLLVCESAITGPWTADELNNNPSYSVDPTHIYRLTLETRGSSQWREGYLGGSIQADISSAPNTSSVPEPATLLILSLGGLALRKRK